MREGNSLKPFKIVFFKTTLRLLLKCAERPNDTTQYNITIQYIEPAMPYNTIQQSYLDTRLTGQYSAGVSWIGAVCSAVISPSNAGF